MRSLCLFLFILFIELLFSFSLNAQKWLIVGRNRDSPDGISFVCTEDVTSSDVLYLTENGYNNITDVFSGSESIAKYIPPAGGHMAGEVITIREGGAGTGDNTYEVVACSSSNCGTVSNVGSTIAIGNMDELYAYSDTDDDPGNGVTAIYCAWFWNFSEQLSEDPTGDFPNAKKLNFPSGSKIEFDPTKRNLSLTATVYEDLENYTISTDNSALSSIPFTGGFILGPPVCPTLAMTTTTPAAVCEGDLFNVTASGLTDMNIASNIQQDFGIAFRAFSNTPDDPYTDGIVLGDVSFSELGDGGSTATLTGASLPPGNYEVYAILNPTPDEADCRPVAMTTVTVTALPTVTFSTDGLSNVCADADLQTGLSGGMPTGGTYSGPGVTDNGNGETFSFDAAMAGTGLQTISYTYFAPIASIDVIQSDNSALVSNTASRLLQSFIPSSDNICGAGVFVNDNGASAEITLSVWDKIPSTSDAIMLGEEVILATSGGYADVMWPEAEMIPGETYYLLIQETNLDLGIRGSTTNPYPDGVAYNALFQAVPEVDISFRTFSCSESTCSGEATVQVEVFALPEVSFTPDISMVSVDAGVQTGLGGGMPAGGVYSGNGVTDDGNGMTYSFDPATAGEGENVITYNITDANGCDGEQGGIITVTSALIPGDLCDDAIDISDLFGQEEMVPQVSESFNNAGYSVSGTDPTTTDCGFDFNGASPIWYAFTGDGNRYNIASINSSVDLAAILYSGECENLSELECNGPGGVNFGFEFQTEAGVEYALLVYNDFPNSTGGFDLEITNLGAVSVQDIRNTAFNVYPNPTNGWVQLDGFTADRIEVLDQLGRKVRTQGQAGNGVDLSGLPAGVYVLRMQAGNEVYSAKVVKE